MLARNPAVSHGGAAAVALKHGRRWLYVLHRWIGIFTCLLCAMWFVSGVVMMYVPYPKLSERDRMDLSQPIDWSQVRISPDQALKTDGDKVFPNQLRVSMLLGQPVYRILAKKKPTTISAVDGRRIGPISAAQALQIVRGVRPDAAGATVRKIMRDQWVVAQGFDPDRPLYKVSLHDAQGAELYVSSTTGEVVNATTRTQRFWNWLGAVPHWIYPTALRRNGEVWRQVVLWVSGPAIFGAGLGVWVGILRLKLKRRYTAKRVSPYRGWMKWHHIAGLIAGLFVVTWLFSGWLSLNPFRWFERTPSSHAGTLDYMGQARPLFAADVAGLRALPSGQAREARLTWLAGRPLVVLEDAGLRESVYDGRTGAPAPLDDAAIFADARKLVPGARVVFARRLTQEDDYWYSHHTQRRLPVLRVGFDDPARTWVHIDPVTGEVLGRSGASARVYRWLFNCLHDFDLPLLLHHRPLWDGIVLMLSLGGLIVSISGIVIGWRRLGYKLRRAST